MSEVTVWGEEKLTFCEGVEDWRWVLCKVKERSELEGERGRRSRKMGTTS